MQLKYDTWEIRQGDVLDLLACMEAESVQTVCTSPPYFGLRNYGVKGQLGLERTVGEYVENMVRVFREVRRVLRNDGTLWLNLGDSYAGSGKGPTGHNGLGDQEKRQGFHSPKVAVQDNLKPKDLMMVPARVALALQDDGWYLRSDIAWCKRAPMPESVIDRPTSAHEHIYLLAKQGSYYYDSDAVREQTSGSYNGPTFTNGKTAAPHANVGQGERVESEGRNMWNYVTHPWDETDDAWLLSPENCREAHFAVFPSSIPRRAILAGSSERGCCAECGSPYRRVVERTPMVIARSERHEAMGEYGRTQASGTMVSPAHAETIGWEATCSHNAPVVPCVVLDPFSGSGTTVKTALRLGRRGLGIEINPEYVEMSERLIRNDAPLFNNIIQPQEQPA